MVIQLKCLHTDNWEKYNNNDFWNIAQNINQIFLACILIAQSLHFDFMEMNLSQLMHKVNKPD